MLAHDHTNDCPFWIYLKIENRIGELQKNCSTFKIFAADFNVTSDFDNSYGRTQTRASFIYTPIHRGEFYVLVYEFERYVIIENVSWFKWNARISEIRYWSGDLKITNRIMFVCTWQWIMCFRRELMASFWKLQTSYHIFPSRWSLFNRFIRQMRIFRSNSSRYITWCDEIGTFLTRRAVNILDI